MRLADLDASQGHYVHIVTWGLVQVLPGSRLGKTKPSKKDDGSIPLTQEARLCVLLGIWKTDTEHIP